MLQRFRKTADQTTAETLSFGLLMLFIASSLSADNSNLNKKNPFLPPGHGVKALPPKPEPTTNGPISRDIEFRGIIQIDGVYKFSLFSKSEQKGYWISQKETEGKISVQTFDLDSMTVTVGKDGRAERLTMISATDNPLPVSVSTALQLPAVNSKKVINRVPSNNTKNRPVVPRRRVILPKN